MAVNSITFGGVNSADFGIYISGEGVFNAPKRDVEMIAIPGRDGELALDKGRFENIEVTYPAFNFEPNDYETFAKNLSDFRNAICSLRGYQRLTDTFHPDEYRMAAYIGGLEIKPIKYNTASEFSIIFDCKPQRYLTDGETPITLGEWGETETETVSGDIVEIDNLGIEAVKSLSVELEPIQEGSGTPSPDNVRPISGRTECVTSVSGINVWDEEWEVGAYSGTTGAKSSSSAGRIRSKNYIAVIPNTAYYATTLVDAVCFYDAEKNYLNNYTDAVRPFTTPSNCGYITFYSKTNYGTTYNNDISINYPSTDTSYHAYNGHTYTTTLGRTVYGGTLDVVSGVLTVTDVTVTYNGTESWTSNGVGAYYTPCHSLKKLLDYRTAIVCDKMETFTQSYAPAYIEATEGICGFYDVNGSYPNQNWIYAKGGGATTTSAFKAWLADNPLQVVYELATPQTYQLTGQDIELIEGNNYIWSDGGDVTVEHGQNPNFLINPTRFESSPLLMVEGYGTIRFNGYQVIVNNAIVGDVQLSPAITDKWTRSNVNYDGSLLNQGDPITVHGNRVVKFEARLTDTSYTVTGQSLIRTTANITGNFSYTASKVGDGYNFELTYEGNDTFSYGYEGQINDYFTLELTRTKNGVTSSVTRTIQVSFVANTTYIRFIVPASSSADGITFTGLGTYSTGEITAVSTQYVLGHPTYVDCDYGEAYKIVDGRIVSLNKYIDLGSDLPKLGAGANEVTADDTITELQIVPRWWRV